MWSPTVRICDVARFAVLTVHSWSVFGLRGAPLRCDLPASGTLDWVITSRVGLVDRVGPAGWWIARSLLVAVSLVALVSFGGQLILAPFLIPTQWLAARRSELPGRVLFTTLAGLLVGELGWMAGYVIAGDTAAMILGAASAAIAAALLFTTTAHRS